MSKTILTQIDGWTPLPDLLVIKYGLVTAAVWASAWRYCQMSDGICRASIEKIGGRIKLSRQSTMKHMQTLVDDGFFEDTTPNLKNKPHVYRDTGKVAMYNRFGIGVKEVDSGVNLVDSQSQVSLHEDSIKKEDKTTNEEGGVFTAFENNIQMLTPMTSEMLGELIDEHGAQWVIKAIEEAALNGKRNLKYIKAILDRWKSDGYGTPYPRQNGNKSNTNELIDKVLGVTDGNS